MLHRNSSAGTAVQKSSKSSLIQRPAIILAMLLLCAVFCHAQNDTLKLKNFTATSIEFKYSYDTSKVFMLCADTSYKSGFNKFAIFLNSNDTSQNVAEVKNRVPYCFWLFGYSIHSRWDNAAEYLDDNKKVLSKKIFVIMSVSIK